MVSTATLLSQESRSDYKRGVTKWTWLCACKLHLQKQALGHTWSVKTREHVWGGPQTQMPSGATQETQRKENCPHSSMCFPAFDKNTQGLQNKEKLLGPGA